jgi:hypothetical protein
MKMKMAKKCVKCGKRVDDVWYAQEKGRSKPYHKDCYPPESRKLLLDQYKQVFEENPARGVWWYKHLEKTGIPSWFKWKPDYNKMTMEQLKEAASEEYLFVVGRSKMNKQRLIDAIRKTNWKPATFKHRKKIKIAGELYDYDEEISMDEAIRLHKSRLTREREGDEKRTSRTVSSKPSIGWRERPSKSDVEFIDTRKNIDVRKKLAALLKKDMKIFIETMDRYTTSWKRFVFTGYTRENLEEMFVLARDKFDQNLGNVSLRRKLSTIMYRIVEYAKSSGIKLKRWIQLQERVYRWWHQVNIGKSPWDYQVPYSQRKKDFSTLKNSYKSKTKKMIPVLLAEFVHQYPVYEEEINAFLKERGVITRKSMDKPSTSIMMKIKKELAKPRWNDVKSEDSITIIKIFSSHRKWKTHKNDITNLIRNIKERYDIHQEWGHYVTSADIGLDFYEYYFEKYSKEWYEIPLKHLRPVFYNWVMNSRKS